MRRVLGLLVSVIVLFLTAGLGAASADPVKSPRVDFGTIVCGDVTYKLVSPFGAPVSHALTAPTARARPFSSSTRRGHSSRRTC